MNCETLSLILNILQCLSRDDKFIVERIVECNLVNPILEVLNRKSLERDLVIVSLRIIGNLLASSDQIVEVF